MCGAVHTVIYPQVNYTMQQCPSSQVPSFRRLWSRPAGSSWFTHILAQAVCVLCSEAHRKVLNYVPQVTRSAAHFATADDPQKLLPHCYLGRSARDLPAAAGRILRYATFWLSIKPNFLQELTTLDWLVSSPGADGQ